MKLNEPYLIINLNENKFIFSVISFDENKGYKSMVFIMAKLLTVMSFLD